MYTVTPEKMEVQPWVEKHSLIEMHLSLVESTLTHCDFKYLCPFRRTHIGHPIGFLETSKHKYLKHPKPKALGMYTGSWLVVSTHPSSIPQAVIIVVSSSLCWWQRIYIYIYVKSPSLTRRCALI